MKPSDEELNDTTMQGTSLQSDKSSTKTATQDVGTSVVDTLAEETLMVFMNFDNNGNDEMKDDGEPDDKIICVSTNDPRYLHTSDIENIEDHYRSEIAHFFQVYKELEGKKVEILGWKDAKEAKKVVIESIKRYKETLKKY